MHNITCCKGICTMNTTMYEYIEQSTMNRPFWQDPFRQQEQWINLHKARLTCITQQRQLYFTLRLMDHQNWKGFYFLATTKPLPAYPLQAWNSPFAGTVHQLSPRPFRSLITGLSILAAIKLGESQGFSHSDLSGWEFSWDILSGQ